MYKEKKLKSPQAWTQIQMTNDFINNKVNLLVDQRHLNYPEFVSTSISACVKRNALVSSLYITLATLVKNHLRFYCFCPLPSSTLASFVINVNVNPCLKTDNSKLQSHEDNIPEVKKHS